LNKGFKRGEIANEPKEIAGYNFDIFANKTERNQVKKRAFGEIKSVVCNKGLAEVFTDWINNQVLTKSLEYERERDYLLFIAPDYTPEAQKVLESHQVECLTYKDVTVDNILNQIEEEKVKDLTKTEKKAFDFINSARTKCRSFNKMVNLYSRELMENLVKKGKVEIKKRGKTNVVCIKKQ